MSAIENEKSTGARGGEATTDIVSCEQVPL